MGPANDSVGTTCQGGTAKGSLEPFLRGVPLTWDAASPELTSREMSVAFQVAVSRVKRARPSLSVVSVCVVVPCLP